MKKHSFIVMLSIALCMPFVTRSQESAVPDSSIAAIRDTAGYDFSINLPALTQIPGAPEPFYTYLWDFGDGHFSSAQNPIHQYTKPGEYDVYLYAVNNYDDGKKPDRKKKKVVVASNDTHPQFHPAAIERDFFKANGAFELKYNCMAKPNDTMVLIAGWKNVLPQDDKGKFYLLLNEQVYDERCFDTVESRFFNVEKFLSETPSFYTALSPDTELQITESGSPASNIKYTIPNNNLAATETLKNTFAAYKNSYSVDLGTIAPGETRFSFIQLHVTPEMIKDTNATVVITGVYVPEKGKPIMHKLNIPVVNSHDPNKMNLKGGRLSYRFLKKNKSLTYKVRFQNNGKGPARKVALDMSLFPGLDPQTVQVKDMSPYCEPCSLEGDKRGCWELVKNDSGAVFTFHGIYLPGTGQNGVEDKDSTQGFMEFSVTTRKKLENKPFRSRTAIYFDKNEPVITNNATGRFKKSPSPLIMAGYEMAFGKGEISNGITTGIAIAPLAPYRPYLQFELYYKQGVKTTTESVPIGPGIVTIDSLKDRIYEYNTGDSVRINNISQLKFIPLHVRYNINDFVGIGVGVSATVDIGGNKEAHSSYNIPDANQGSFMYIKKTSAEVKAFHNWHFQPFIDVQFGKVRLGPSLGFRYLYNGSKNSFGYIYAGWRL